MHLSPPVEPMLARSVATLPAPGARPMLFEQKADGFRVLVFTGPKPYLQSRRGADLGPAFPEITRAAAALGVEAVIDAELVVWHEGRLDFTALQHRARLRGAKAERAAREQPAHLITFDVLEAGAVLMDQPLHQRRSTLGSLFASRGLAAPWALCTQTADATMGRTWLDPAWAAAGVEGLMIKDSGSRYRPGERGWLKLRRRMTAEALIGAVTGAVHAPHSLLFGRLDPAGRLRLIARSTPLSRPAAAELGAVLHPAGPEHPWYGRRFSAGWGSWSSIRSNLTSSPRSMSIPPWISVPTGTPCATCDFVTT
ncbi:ATP-dependent DNA ligase [Streptomyces zagrosensis]|uniref:ATP-dependent DNA ligase n=1 Tax=Streptomyces zagrosensis TaxID=1042984 RepID=A0A7W9QJT2_9ACTN|nr:ATP-dependent DNA ligase [Streptomyces zagrosensis]MBB5940297.1 ATP-dependent DNA ligase [Streptomyces zagrosensis]